MTDTAHTAGPITASSTTASSTTGSSTTGSAPGVEKVAVYAQDLFETSHAKVGHGVVRYAAREVVAVIDSTHAGRTAEEVVPYCARPVPIVATVAEAVALGATVFLIGIAPAGGAMTPQWRAALVEAITAGLDVEAGLHTILGEDAELVALAAEHHVEVRDLRAVPAELSIPEGPDVRPKGLRVVHSVGSDCAIGKMSVTLELDRAARARGERSAFVATGQTGIAITGWGIAVDSVISDYVAGAAERLVIEGAERGNDLLFVEGQGSLHHPAYSGVTLGLLHGSAPDVLVLAHQAGSTVNKDYPRVPLLPLPQLIDAYEAVIAPVKPAKVVAVALNTAHLDDDAARAVCAATEAQTGLPTDDVVRFGPDRILDAVLAALAA
jgi:uncharacterized NAD-dependent epimerase/dehydratase family protein